MAPEQQFSSAFAGAPVPPAPAQPSPPSYIWYGCDLRSGLIIEELPFVPGGPLSSIIGAYSTLQGSIALPDCPPNWEAATDPSRTMLVCVRESDAYPLWAGIVIFRSGGTADTVALTLVSLEGYLDRRYVGDRVEVQRNGPQIALDLAFDAMDTEGLGMSVDDYLGFTVPGDALFDRTYTAFSDQTAYSQLTEIMGVIGGPEWTMYVDWQDESKTAFKKIFYTRTRIGVGSLTPNAAFDLPGCIREYELAEDWSTGKGANHIQTFGDGEGEARPASLVYRADSLIAAGWPRYEFRKTYSSVIYVSTLNGHANELLRNMREGSQFSTVTANAATAPVLGVDWYIGDDITLDVYASPRHPDGLTAIRRAVGWQLDTLGGTVTPLFPSEPIDEG